MSASRQFLSRLGLQHPIIQAPMAGVSTPRLAAAVCNAGGLGSLGIGACTLAQARQAIEATRALTDRPFNVNVFCHAPARRDAAREAAWLAYLTPLFAEVGATPPAALEEIYNTFQGDRAALALLLELRPSVVSFHFGLPNDAQLQALRDAGIYTLATATCLQEARLIEQAGIDAIVAQGIEAGGHRGIFDPTAADERLSGTQLIAELIRHTRLPIIAAGGIMDGADIKAALSWGAAAAQLGTAFILCPESAADEGYRTHLNSQQAATTRLTRVFSGRPARALLNRFITFGEMAGSPIPADYPLAYDAAKQLNAAASKLGYHDFAAHWAGQGAARARQLPAAQLVTALASAL